MFFFFKNQNELIDAASSFYRVHAALFEFALILKHKMSLQKKVSYILKK